MKQLILNEPGHLSLREVDMDLQLAADQALVKVHRIGVCGTDIHAFGGNQPFFSYPRVLGHELGLEVVKIGEQVSNVEVGDKCSLEPYFNVKEGQAARLGKPNCNEFISVFGVHEDGGMQEFVKVPARYLHPSQKLSYDQLALVETLAIGYHAVQRAEVKSTDKVLVIGAGPIGLAALQFTGVLQADTVVMDINQDRLDFCANLGVHGVINSLTSNPLEELSKLFDGDLPTVVFDCTGNPKSMMSAFEYPSHGGKLVFVGLFQGEVNFHDPSFHKKELTLFASRNALSKDFDEIIALIEAGQIDTQPWITHKASVDEVVDVFEKWTKPESKVIKAMIEMS
ncbi:MAG: L-iditol 2-dehydrogenase [Flammeovirgaceae bacterium]|nr:L-iditol 2-dehydrogenase [Flammeovirgaceae bacterium]HCX23443.1 L-iditol 2-dehydrogenase [Cytophagales bacterium]